MRRKVPGARQSRRQATSWLASRVVYLPQYYWIWFTKAILLFGPMMQVENLTQEMSQYGGRVEYVTSKYLTPFPG